MPAPGQLALSSCVRVREETWTGGLPALTVGHGKPLIWLGGSTPNHRHPAPGLERRLSLAPLLPYVRAGRQVTLLGRWPGMPVGTSFADIAARHVEAIADRFSHPVDIIGVSTGGSLLLQMLTTQATMVRRGVVISASATLEPHAQFIQHCLAESVRATGTYSPQVLTDLLLSTGISPLLGPVVRRIAGAASERVTLDNPADTLAMLLAEADYNVHDQLSSVPTPTLLVAGDKDLLGTEGVITRTAQTLPKGELAWYPKLGHAPTRSRTVRRRIIDFLDEG